MTACPKCQAQSAPEDKYCNRCGYKLDQSFRTSGAKVTQRAMNTEDVRYKLGMVYFKRGKYREAIETWQKLLVNESNNTAVKQLIDEARKELKIITS